MDAGSMTYVASLPAQVGAIAYGMRAYYKEGMKNWREQNPEAAAAEDAKKGRTQHFRDGAGR